MTPHNATQLLGQATECAWTYNTRMHYYECEHGFVLTERTYAALPDLRIVRNEHYKQVHPVSDGS